MPRKFWTNEENQILKDNYRKNDSIDKDLLLKLIPDKNYKQIKYHAMILGLTKHPNIHNKDYFSIPNVQNCAIAGNIAADGSLDDIRNRLCFCVHKDDKNYIEQIKKLIDFNGKIYEIKRKIINRKINPKQKPLNFTSFSVSMQIGKAKKVIEDLKKYWNITPRKSSTLLPPKLKNIEHIFAFISGYIDGDGSISIYNRKDLRAQQHLIISFVGTKEMMLWIKSMCDYFMPFTINCNIGQRKESPNCYTYRIYGLKAYIFAKYCFSLDILRLDRKWNKTKKYIESLEKLGFSDRDKVKLNKIINEQIKIVLPKNI